MKKHIPWVCAGIAACLALAIAAEAKTPAGSVFRYAKQGDAEKLKSLVEEDPAVVGEKTEGGWTALFFAAKENQAEAVKVLLAAKADPNAKSESGEALLHVVAEAKAVDALKALLAGGADPDIRNADGSTPLHLATARGSIDVVKALLDGKADPLAKTPGGSTPLQLAAELGQTELVDALLKKGAPANIRDPREQPLLHAAVRSGNAPLAKLLLGHGADARARDGSGNTALHWAVAGRRADSIRALLDAGADAKATNAFGQTPADIAAVADLLGAPPATDASVPGAGQIGLPAFPNAEGFGAAAAGGRGGKVLHVTTLADSGPGSLREALEQQGARIIVFDVGGTIRLVKILEVKTAGGSYTLAGQTAPGGITISGAHFAPAAYRQQARDFIIRHLRVRQIAGGEADGIGLFGEKFILDHVSISGGCDENIGSHSGEYTLQWCSIEESALWGQAGASHAEWNHNYGMLQGYNPKARLTIHHCLFANHQKRLPLVCALSAGAGLDYRNNVSFNWGNTASDFSDCPGGCLNVVNNCYVMGPSTDPKHPSSAWCILADSNSLIYPPKLEGNVFFKQPPGTAPPETTIREYGRGGYTYSKDPWPAPPVATEPAVAALESVLTKGGAWPRDATTRRTMAEVRAGTKAGGLGLRGPYEIFPERKGPCAAESDTDRDGMPDAWEKAHGLDPKHPADGNKFVPRGASEGDRHAGYTYVEYYLNELADGLVGKSGVTHVIQTGAEPEDGGAVIADHGVCGWATDLNGGFNRPFWFGRIVFGTAEYNEGSFVEMKAKPKPGYVFDHWQGAPVDGLTATRVRFPAKAAATVTAHFRKLPPWTARVAIQPKDAGDVAGDGPYSEGDTVTLAAYAAKGYRFRRWSGGPADKAVSPSIQFAAQGKATLTAEFQPGEGGDAPIDDFNDQDVNSLLRTTAGDFKTWILMTYVTFCELGPGNYGMASTRADAYRDLDLRGGVAIVPAGATVVKFKVHNLDDKAARLEGDQHRMTFRTSAFEAGLFYAEPFQFPVVEPRSVGVLEVPLALIRPRNLSDRIKPGDGLSWLHFRGVLSSSLWGAKVAVDDVAFGRASAEAIPAPNLAPVAEAGRDQIAQDLDGDGKELILLDGTRSHDRDAGAIRAWSWSIDGKDIAQGFAPSAELPVGSHTMTLAITDEQGAQATDTVAIVVKHGYQGR